MAKKTPAQQGAVTRAYNRQVTTATTTRQKHEADHPERYQGVETLAGHVSHRQTYRDMGIGVEPHAQQNIPGQQELPGMHHPGTVTAPPKWEDMPEKSRNRVLKNAAKFGVTPESAHKALGAQVDQAALREQKMGNGQHRSFYAAEGHDADGAMLPRTRLKTSAAENGVSFTEQAVANAITSPKQKFVATPKSGKNKGVTHYPNDLQATHAIQEARTSKPVEEITGKPGVAGMHGNTRRAAAVIRHMDSGKSVAESWNPGPKTGVYHNSWVDPHGSSQTFTSDIHSGGGGIAPHLDQKGREKFLGIAGIHSFNDHIARKVASERGIGSMSGMQSMQWSEERRQRGLEDDHKRPQPRIQQPQIPGQRPLF